jgi:transcriptional regulator with XRE-family HTH domain
MTKASLSIAEIGEALRRARLAANLSLGDVAAGTGLSSSFLSLVENGKSDISLGRLSRLTDFLDVRLSDLVQDGGMESRFQISRKGERPTLSTNEGVVSEFLPRMQGYERFVMTFEPGGTINVEDYRMALRGESFYLMLKGELNVELSGPKVLRLKAGDCLSLLHQDFRRSWNDRRQPAVVFAEVRHVRPESD